MFGLMKNLLKEKTPAMQAVGFGDLHVGCRVGFGFMPQKSLSGRRLQVTETNSYIFDGDSFLAYRLEDDGTEINLIIAGEGDSGYLALSLQLEARLYDLLFDTCQPQSWFALPEGYNLEITPHVLGAPRGWLAPRYTLAMKTKGRMLEGDYRMRKPEGRLSLSRPFDYVLFVDFANNYALEAERYEDGTLNVYATVYRPQTDIGEMVRPSRLEIMPIEEVVLDEENFMRETLVKPSVERVVQPLPQLAAFAPVEEALSVHGKFGRIPVNAPPVSTVNDMLACELKLAGRIIDEAVRNRMGLAELIRKIIDLPVKGKDEVLIPFELDPAEYAELARRYDVPASDYEAVRAQIIEELKHFAGIKG